MPSVTAFAPATVANLNCGFDVLGMALEMPGDEVNVAFNETDTLQVVKITGDNGKLPYDIDKNTAAVAIKALCEHLGEKRGMDIAVTKKMPLGSGMGSSAASAVAGVFAANELLGNRLSKRELMPFVLKGEEAATGSAHGDNVFPSLLGGIVLIRSYSPLDVVALPVPSHLYCALLHPDVEILTKQARGILPQAIALKTAIAQTGNIAAFVAGLYEKDLALVGRSMTDLFAEPYRAPLIPEFERVRNAALYGGALAFGISGSGPAMFALCDSSIRAQQVGELMQRGLVSKNIACELYISRINKKGAMILNA
jgi:homoserine kinase